METTLKQRLVGTAVIIALAVIFVPMILDGPGRQESTVMEAELPLAPPKFNFESQLPDPEKLDELPAAEKSSEPDAGQATAEEKSEAGILVLQEKKPAPDVVEATAGHIEPRPSLSAWAVQVAAFEEKDKALALQEKLVAGNYSAFTEEFVDEGKVLYRVKAGPELKRENADQLRAKIETDQGITGAFVTPHP